MKLRYRKNGTTHDLNLQPVKPDKGWAVNWHDRVYYAELVAVNNSRATDLRTRCGGTIYSLAEVQRDLSKMLTYSGTTAVTLNGDEQTEDDSTKKIYQGDLASGDYNSACISITAVEGTNLGEGFILNGNAKNNYIDVSAHGGNNTIDAGAGNNTIVTGDGEELIICPVDGTSDQIVGLTSDDSIQLRGYNGEEVTYTATNDGVIFTVGTGKISITGAFENAVELDVHFIDDDGNEIHVTDKVFRAGAIAEYDGNESYVSLIPAANNFTAMPTDVLIDAAQVTTSPLTIDASNADALIQSASVPTNYTFGEDGGTVSNFKANDTLNIDEKIYSCSYDAANSLITFDFKDGDLELRGVTDNGIYLNGSTKIYVGDDLLYNNADLASATGVTLVANYRDNFSVVEQGITGNVSVDASATEQLITITGGDGNDYILGGATIEGGAGNDTLIAAENSAVITGGDGNDLFFVTAKGNKLITDFTPASEQLSLSAEDFDALTSIETLGGNVVLNFEQGTLTLENVSAENVISINGTGYYLTPDAIWNTARTYVTLLSPATVDATQSPYDTAKKIYAKSGGSINGAGRADSITIGGANGVELTGHANSQVKDTFIYGGGDATIDYSTDDRVSIQSGLVMTDYTLSGGVLQVQITDAESNPKGVLTFYGVASVVADDSGADSDTQGTPLTMLDENGNLKDRYFNPYGIFNKKNPKYATSVTLTSHLGDFGVQKDSAGNPSNWFDTNPVSLHSGEYYANITTITSALDNSTVIGNAKSNEIYINGGGYYNFIVSGLGKDSVTFDNSGGILPDHGLGAPKSGAAKTYATAFTTSTYNRFNVDTYFANIDYLKVKGTVTGFYYDRTITNTKSKRISTVTVLVTYTDLKGETQVIFLPHINKKATTTNSTNPAKRTWNNHNDAVATLKIWQGKNATSQLTSNSLSAKYKEIADFPEELRPRVIELYRRYFNSPFYRPGQQGNLETLPAWLVL